ncbi:hypothetical protein A3SI_18814 [Nitritalea halalkaliphila LW7]|uniref:Uncharacterized protein n=1 Tax=Nitritalea halalkaliphila LW7 TaxID=1189621 RepID=I5BTX8_9BACT|nr:hypothetical protein A3SI_18814 [Nitritalea halalkaliphila LW7]
MIVCFRFLPVAKSLFELVALGRILVGSRNPEPSRIAADFGKAWRLQPQAREAFPIFQRGARNVMEPIINIPHVMLVMDICIFDKRCFRAV